MICQSSRRTPAHVLCLLLVLLSFGSCKSQVESKFSASNDRVSNEVSFEDAPSAQEPPSAMEEIASADGETEGMKREVAPAKQKADAKDDDGDADEDTKKGWKRSVISANTSRLMIGENEELPIQGMEIFARVDGFRARVLIDFYFYNDEDAQYEGTFKLRLPEGASPYFLAFGESKVSVDEAKKERIDENELYALSAAATKSKSIASEPEQIMMARQANWIEPKEARMVPKKQAAMAYADTVRQRIDPALMEWGGAGVFNARIFPIAPRKVHRVVVGYDMLVERVGEDLVFDLGLPKDLPSSRVNIQVAKLGKSDVSIVAGETKSKPLEDGESLYYSLQNPIADQIELRIKKAAAHALTTYEQGLGDLFATRVKLDLPAVKTSENVKHPALFLVDKSMSSNPEKFNIWLDMVEAVLEQNRDAIPTFNVMFFDVETRAWQPSFVQNDEKNIKKFRSFADNLSLQGATDIGSALRASTRLIERDEALAKDRVDLFLLSDGSITWGEGDAFLLTEGLKKKPWMGALFAYRTGLEGTDTGMLSHLSRELGGALFSVVGASEVPAAAKAHRFRPYELKSVSLEGGEDVVVAGRPQVVYPGQSLLIAGRGKLSSATPELLFTVSHDRTPQTIEVPLTQRIDSPLTARVYGQIAVDQLEELLGSTRPLAEAYARHFRVAGKSTSLLMLESDAEYEQFGIVPKNDLGAIKQKSVTVAMLNAFDEMAVRLGDAKASLMDWIEELEEMPGVKVLLPPELLKELQALDTSAYRIEAALFEAEEARKSALSKSYLGDLARRDVDYLETMELAEKQTSKKQKFSALRTASSLVEQSPGDSVLARDIGYSALQWGLPDHAYHLFARVARARPYEPQTWRALAMAAAEQGKVALATAFFEIGLAGEWDARFGEFKRILAQDYLRFIYDSASAAPSPKLKSYLKERQGELTRIFGVEQADLVVTLTWNTDNTDVDLHVMEPNGDECFYGHRETRSGGKLTQDVTQGYGPEMYVMEKAPRGKYRIRAKYFSSDQNRKSARTKVYATIIRNWGKSNASVERRTVTLESNKDMHDILTVKMP